VSDDRTNLARRQDSFHEAHDWAPRPAGTVLPFRSKKLISRIVDVYAGSEHIAAYTVCLEDEGCLDCEFEEAALIIAEQSGRAAEGDLLIARCHSDI